jgi:uncharacterized membrane protein SpoIIM required for sporulation
MSAGAPNPPGAEALRSARFRREREAAWAELDRLLGRAERRGIEVLEPDELIRLPALYRATVSSLSVARAISLDRNVLDYLENLARRGYFMVYAPRLRPREALAAFLARGFPAAVRDARWHVLVAALIMALGIATGWIAVARDDELFDALVPEAMAEDRGPSASTGELREVLYDEDGSALSRLQLFASFLFTHNAQIGIMSFAFSFALGVPTFLLLVYNGIVLGAFAALHQGRGLGADFWGWVLPHGVTEIGAIVLCGGAGLMIADSLIFPGSERRLDRLAEQGRKAGQIVLGAIAMLLVAALIEGFFRQLVQDIVLRYGLAASTLILWGLYFTLAGRGTGEPGDG